MRRTITRGVTYHHCTQVLDQGSSVPGQVEYWAIAETVPLVGVAFLMRSHDGLQPLPHDRDCPQANLILRGRVWDSHHPVGGYLPSNLVIGASLQKVNAENKSRLACHLLRLL
jgi:hypothetical protein